MLTAAAPCAIGVVAVGIVVSAVLVVSREPFDPMSAVVPTIPVTTTPTAAPSISATIPPATTVAPSYVPPSTSSAVIATTAQPSTAKPSPKPPEITATHPPISAHPTPHPAFPQETTDFQGPPGTNG